MVYLVVAGLLCVPVIDFGFFVVCLFCLFEVPTDFLSGEGQTYRLGEKLPVDIEIIEFQKSDKK